MRDAFYYVPKLRQVAQETQWLSGHTSYDHLTDEITALADDFDFAARAAKAAHLRLWSFLSWAEDRGSKTASGLLLDMLRNDVT